MKFIVTNNVTDTVLVYTDIIKARIAIEYLEFTSPYHWTMEIKAK